MIVGVVFFEGPHVHFILSISISILHQVYGLTFLLLLHPNIIYYMYKTTTQPPTKISQLNGARSSILKIKDSSPQRKGHETKENSIGYYNRPPIS
mgnify:CR=1 FL=1